MPSVTFECGECGHQEERNLKKVYNETAADDDFELEGDEVEACPSCGSKDITDYTNGVRLRDTGREDFHSDG